MHDKAVNQKDGLGMKVPSRLLFTDEEKFINILIEMLSKLLQYGKVLKEKKSTK